jgi:hypothetical protein
VLGVSGQLALSSQQPLSRARERLGLWPHRGQRQQEPKEGGRGQGCLGQRASSLCLLHAHLCRSQFTTVPTCLHQTWISDKGPQAPGSHTAQSFRCESGPPPGLQTVPQLGLCLFLPAWRPAERRGIGDGRGSGAARGRDHGAPPLTLACGTPNPHLLGH